MCVAKTKCSAQFANHLIPELEPPGVRQTDLNAEIVRGEKTPTSSIIFAERNSSIRVSITGLIPSRTGGGGA